MMSLRNDSGPDEPDEPAGASARRPVSRTRAALRGAAATYASRGVTVVVGLVVTPIVLWYLGNERYGVWAIMATLLGYAGMLDLGITGSLGTLIARANRDDSGDEISALGSNAIVLHSLAGLTVLAAGLIGASYFPGFFKLEGELRELAPTVLGLAIIAFAISFPVRSLKAVLRGTHHIATLRSLELVNSLLRTGLLLLLLSLGLGLLALPLSMIAINLWALLLFLIVTKRLCPSLRLSAARVSLSGVRGIFGVSLWWLLGSLGGLIVYQVDNLIIGRVLGPAVVTVYALTYRLPEVIRDQIFQLDSVLQPGLGDLAGRGEHARLRAVLSFALRITLVTGVTACVFVLLYNRTIVALWVGAERFAGQAVTIVFALSLVYLVVYHSFSAVLTALLRLKSLAIVRWSEGVLNLVLSLILVRPLGALGVGLATLLAGLVTSFWFVPWQAVRAIDLSWRELGRSVGRPLGAFSLAISAFGLLLARLAPPGPAKLLGAAIHMSCFLLGTGLLVAFIVFTKAELRTMIKERKLPTQPC